MTVEELIDRLQGYDKNMMVVVDGYEGGYNPVHDVEVLMIELNANEGIGYYGIHGDVERGKSWVKAVYFPR